MSSECCSLFDDEFSDNDDRNVTLDTGGSEKDVKCDAEASAASVQASRSSSPDLFGWERPLPDVDGLFMIRGFLSSEAQSSLEAIIRKLWIHSGLNQGMVLGHIPDELMPLIESTLRPALSLLPASCFPILPSDPPSDMLWNRTPLFTQLIANHYAVGEGIKPHVDLRQFADGIVSLSLLAPTCMEFRPVKKGTAEDVIREFRQTSSATLASSTSSVSSSALSVSSCSVDVKCDETMHHHDQHQHSKAALISDNHNDATNAIIHRLFLEPGDLLVLQGAARWDWVHSIPSSTFDTLTPDAHVSNWSLYVGTLLGHDDITMQSNNAGVLCVDAVNQAHHISTVSSSTSSSSCMPRHLHAQWSGRPPPGAHLVVPRAPRISLTLRRLDLTSEGQSRLALAAVAVAAEADATTIVQKEEGDVVR